MKLSVIIPTYNNQELLEKCLEKLKIGLEFLKKEGEVIIVDNGGSCRLSDDRLSVVRNNKNLGFARACNQGAEKAKGEYLLFLNNDCFVEKNTIEEMVSFLDKNKELVATQPIIINGIATSPAAPRNDKEVGYVVDLKKGKANPTSSLDFARDYDGASIFQRGWVYGLSGTCLLIRKNIFIEMKGFDESFHSYLEDVDLFIRLAKKNYHYYPTFAAVCHHGHMTTSQKMGSYKQRHDFINWIRIIIKNYPLSFILKNCISLLGERSRNLNGIIKKVIG